MNIIVVGLSHHTASIETREKLAFDPNRIEEPLRGLVALPDIREGVLLSTCNRVEVYAVTRDIAGGIARIKRFLAAWHELPYEEVAQHLYGYHGENAIRHVFRVAASLDSLVVGESQVLGQVKAAYGYAAEYGTSGLILNRFLHKAFFVAKRVRTETGIAASAVSIAFAAVELAKKIFGDLSDKTVLLIGAGEMGELAAKHFIGNGVRSVLVANRTFERGERLAEELAGRPVRFEDLFDHLHKADIILSSTGACHCIIGPNDVADAVRRRKQRPMFFIDIAVPRDVDPEVNELDNVYLYNTDDLQGIVESNREQRLKEATKAEEIVAEEAGRFLDWLSSLEVVPTIVALRSRFDEIVRAEVERTMVAWKGISPEHEKRVEAMTAAMISKLLHTPISVLKHTGQGNRIDLYLDALRSLFDLQIEATGKNEAMLGDDE
jgi:glutamyl-tRNA reductase